MDISNRLKAIVSAISHDILADIGTDHGYIPIHAMESGKIKKAIACDINPKPLQKATANIATFGFQENIETRLGSGFSPLAVGEVETAVIAGMGGFLVIRILDEGAPQVARLSQLILSPQSDLPRVRMHVHQIGFTIADEHLLFDESKFYHILNCHRGAEPAYTHEEYMLGKILLAKKDGVFMDYVATHIKEFTRIIRRLQQGGAKEDHPRLQEMTTLLTLYQSIETPKG